MNIAGTVGAKQWTRIACVVFLCTAPVALTACQSDPDIDITKLAGETDPPEVLYNQGLANHAGLAERLMDSALRDSLRERRVADLGAGEGR